MTAATETKVPWRYKRQLREAEKKRGDEFNAAVHNARVELAALPTAPPKQRVPLRDRDRLPVARPLMTNPKDEIAWFFGFVRNRIRHHFWRLDLHARTFWCAVGRGLARGAVQSRRYVLMPEGLIALHNLAERVDKQRLDEHTLRYAKKKKAHQYAAGSVAGSALLVLAVLLAAFGWPLTLVALFLTVPPALAVYGRRRGDAPEKLVKVDTRPVPKSDPRPSPDLIHQAFHESGIKGIVVETAPHRVGGGWETIVRIPIGTQTFRDAAKVHPAIAGNLGAGSDGLVLAPILGPGGSTKHVRVWYSKTNPFDGDLVPHPFLDPARIRSVDLWNDGLPIGLDARGTEIRIPLVDTPWINLVGQPRSGKSFAFLDIITGIAADPLWDLDCFSFKASDDFSPAKPLVKACGGTYVCGANDAAYKAFLDYLKHRNADVTERNEALGRLPIERRFRMKVEREVAADPTLVPRMRPRVFIADEILTALGSKYGPAILAEMEEGGRTFLSQNVVGILGSQFADSDTYEDLQKLLGPRICLSVARWQDSKGALGDRGHDPDLANASTIPLAAKGVAFVDGALDDPDLGKRGTAVKTRFYGNDLRWVEAHIARCLAGPRSGQVATRVDLEKPDPEAEAFRIKVAELFQPGESALTFMVLGERMGLGTGPRAGRNFSALVPDGGPEPQTDTSGKVTGSRGAQYFALDQLTDTP